MNETCWTPRRPLCRWRSSTSCVFLSTCCRWSSVAWCRCVSLRLLRTLIPSQRNPQRKLQVYQNVRWIPVCASAQTGMVGLVYMSLRTLSKSLDVFVVALKAVECGACSTNHHKDVLMDVIQVRRPRKVTMWLCFFLLYKSEAVYGATISGLQ